MSRYGVCSNCGDVVILESEVRYKKPTSDTSGFSLNHPLRQVELEEFGATYNVGMSFNFSPTA